MIIFVATSRSIIISEHFLQGYFSCRLLVLVILRNRGTVFDLLFASFLVSLQQRIENQAMLAFLWFLQGFFLLTIFYRFDPASMRCCCHPDCMKEATAPLLYSSSRGIMHTLTIKKEHILVQALNRCIHSIDGILIHEERGWSNCTCSNHSFFKVI